VKGKYLILLILILSATALYSQENPTDRKKSRNVIFDGIIISDNNALGFFKKHRLGIFGDIPAVFCEINNYIPELIADTDNITGIAENAAA